MRPIDRVNLCSSQEPTNQDQPQFTLVPTGDAPTPPAARRHRYHLYTPAEIEAFPETGWLIEDIVKNGSFAVLYGPSSIGKSFVALDMALCIATGKPWQERPVEQGTVVYVIGEGKGGI